MSETLGLKNVNMLSKEQYDGVAEPSNDELWAVSGLGVGFPSDRYIDLTLGANGTSYTAPANGYFYFNKEASTNQYAYFDNKNIKAAIIKSISVNNTSLVLFKEVRKGDVISCIYTASGTTNGFRFYYALGEE